MSDATARFALPLLASGQAEKELFHNEALARADMLLQTSVEAIGVDDPPEGPNPGQCWIIGATPTGAWAGQALALAAWTEDGWRFVAPREGMSVWSLTDLMIARFDGAAWTLGEVRGRKLLIGNAQVVGVRQSAIADPAGGATVDNEARSVIISVLQALRAHGLIGD